MTTASIRGARAIGGGAAAAAQRIAAALRCNGPCWWIVLAHEAFIGRVKAPPAATLPAVLKSEPELDRRAQLQQPGDRLPPFVMELDPAHPCGVAACRHRRFPLARIASARVSNASSWGVTARSSVTSSNLVSLHLGGQVAALLNGHSSVSWAKPTHAGHALDDLAVPRDLQRGARCGYGSAATRAGWDGSGPSCRCR